MPEPAKNPANAIGDALSKIGLNIGTTLPLEAAITAAFNFATVNRQTMDDDIQRRWDLIAVQMAEDVYGLWRGLWERAGLVPKKEKSP